MLDILKIFFTLLILIPLSGCKEEAKKEPIHIAARNGDIEAMKKLVEAGTDINLPDSFDSTPLILAAFNNRVELFDYLINAGADIHHRNKEGATALFHAAYHGNEHMVATLLAKGADPNVATTYNTTPLMEAAHFGHTSVVQKLIDANAKLDSVDKDGYTAVLIAVNQGTLNLEKASFIETLKVLIKAGADLTIANKFNESPLSIARNRKARDFLPLIEKASQTPTP